ncbi:MAG TPA: hypothetical protein VGQ09_03320 [Chitinophagaceae bacterium]|jgi:hypothetical protein|nr:hypothetical protein [Chitinophagaceae bacterium]
MKKAFLSLAITAMVATAAIAQEQKEQTPAPQKPAQEQKDVKPTQDQKNVAQDRAAWEKKFKEDLKLTDEQAQKYDALNKEYSDKFEVIAKDASLTPDAQKEKKMALKKEKETRLLEFLTTEQQSKYKELKESMEKKNAPQKQQ